MKKKFHFSLSHEVVIPVLVTLICSSFIVPIFNSVLDALKLTGGNMIHALVDAFFAFAARADSRYLLSSALLVAVIMLLLINITESPGKKDIYPDDPGRPKEKDALSRELDNAERTLAELEQLPVDDPAGRSKLDLLMKSLADIKKKQEKSRLLLLWLSRISKCATVLWAILVLYSYILPSIVQVGFDNTLDIIAPYTSEAEVLQLRSDWRLMDTKEAFYRINGRLLEIRDQNNLY